MAMCRCPGITAIRLFGKAASTVSLAALKECGLSPPSRSNVGYPEL